MPHDRSSQCHAPCSQTSKPARCGVHVGELCNQSVPAPADAYSDVTSRGRIGEHWQLLYQLWKTLQSVPSSVVRACNMNSTLRVCAWCTSIAPARAVRTRFAEITRALLTHASHAAVRYVGQCQHDRWLVNSWVLNGICRLHECMAAVSLVSCVPLMLMSR